LAGVLTRAAGHRPRTWASIATLTAVSLISRLPQLVSPNLLLDGDECIVGLMAKHVADARAFPLFFYGQNYGLAIVEVPAGAVSFLIAGMGAVPLKLAMLALWTTGVVGYFLAMSRIVGVARGFWIALVLILIPAWGVSSMKAWSGYITAFAATGILFALLARARPPMRSAVWLLSGLLTAIVYLAQPLWLPGVLPIVAFVLFAERRAASGIQYVAGTAGVILAIKAIAAGSVFEYWTRPEIGNRNFARSLPDVFEQIYVNLTGSYNLWIPIDAGPVTTLTACVWSAVLVAGVLLQIYRLAAGKHLLWSHLLFVSVVSTIAANWLLLDARDGRYLLPLSALLVMWAGVEVCDLSDRRVLGPRIRRTAVAGAIVLGAVSMVEFRDFSYMWKNAPRSRSEGERLEAVVNYMKMKGARHAYSMHPLLQWQLMFYSAEEILARWTSATDRHPAFVRAVDRALHAGEPVALVGYVSSTRGLEEMVSNPRDIFTVDDRYFVYVGVDRVLLDRLRFRFAAQPH
jgi:hypothetical protein